MHAKVDIQSTGDGFADIEAASYVLKSGSSGPLEILYAPASTGEQLCLVVFRSAGGGSSLVHGVAPAAGIAGKSSGTMGSNTCDVYTDNGFGVLTDSGVNEVFYNPSASAVAADAPIAAMRDGSGVLVIVFEDC